MKLAASATEYARDRADRNLLFWDTPHKRGNVYPEHTTHRARGHLAA
jgi:hypothetical protein